MSAVNADRVFDAQADAHDRHSAMMEAALDRWHGPEALESFYESLALMDNSDFCELLETLASKPEAAIKILQPIAAEVIRERCERVVEDL